MPAASLDCGMETFEADAVVIGAGVVGLACAAELARRGIDVLVVEKDTAIGSGISSRNSEVIHAGIYYPTGSLKHRLCVEGRRKLYAYLAERGVAHRVTSKLIVATTSSEEVAIDAIYARALANGVEGMRRLSGAEAHKLEPELACVAAVESRETGILDTHGYMLALIADIEAGGVAVALGGSCGAIFGASPAWLHEADTSTHLGQGLLFRLRRQGRFFEADLSRAGRRGARRTHDARSRRSNALRARRRMAERRES
jgi:glycine/D-amino acid oxidase-like deaminating enzyme